MPLLMHLPGQLFLQYTHDLLESFPVRLRKPCRHRTVDVEDSNDFPFSVYRYHPGNSWTFSTRTVSSRAAAVPQTPLPTGISMQAGLPWNGPSTSFPSSIR